MQIISDYRNHNKSTNFKSKLHIESKINVEKAIIDLFEKTTKRIPGEVKILQSETSPELCHVHYKKSQNNLGVVKYMGFPTINLKQKNEEAVKSIIATLDDMMAKTGFDYGKENPFSAISKKLLSP